MGHFPLTTQFFGILWIADVHLLPCENDVDKNCDEIGWDWGHSVYMVRYVALRWPWSGMWHLDGHVVTYVALRWPLWSCMWHLDGHGHVCGT